MKAKGVVLEKEKIEEEEEEVDNTLEAHKKKHKWTPELRLEMARDEEEQERKKKEETDASSRFAQPPDMIKEAQKKLNKLEREREDGTRPSQRNIARVPFQIKV